MTGFPKCSLVIKASRSIATEQLRQTIMGLCAFPTRHTLSGKQGADAAADWLVRRLQNFGGNLRVEKDTWLEPKGQRVDKPSTISNVYAKIPGSKHPNHWVVISGHYDSRVTDVMDSTSNAPGANDDASGVAVTLEVARVLANSKPEIGIIFAALTGEEQGLLGAKHLADSLVAKGDTVVAMATYDIVGNSMGADGKKRTDYIRIFSGGDTPGETSVAATRRRTTGLDADSPSRTLARSVADIAKRYIHGFRTEVVYRQDRFGRGGDHSPFHAAGFAAVRFTEPNEDWTHQHQDLRMDAGIDFGDKPEYVDFAYLTNVARLAAAWATEISHAPLSPTGVTLVTDLAPMTTIKWRANADAIGYEILVRRSTKAEWEKTISINKQSATEAKVPFSKDDYVFGIRCVGKNGARSLAVIAGR